MTLAYVDSSCLIAIAFGEPGSAAVATRLDGCERVVAANLLEAEVRAAAIREGVADDPSRLFDSVSWIYPDRPLTEEFRRIEGLGSLKGADLWHLACALFVVPEADGLTFLTLDKRQREVARKLGFDV